MPLASIPDFARTYSTPEEDAWDYVKQYRDTMDYVASHPDKGSTAVGSAVGLPRGRVREWMDGARPDVVRGLDTVVTHGWFPDSYHSPVAKALNELVAAVYATGSIAAENYRPSFVYDGQNGQRIEAALNTLSAGRKVVDRAGNSRATELIPRTDATALGRVLAAAGAPVGAKVDVERLSLPAYLDDAPLSVRSSFAEVYVGSRGTKLKGKATTPVYEDRPATFRKELAALIEEITDESVTVNTNSVILSADAARALGLSQ